MIDVNCSIGHWPFRRLTRNTLPELKAYLKDYGISGGVLTHNHAVCYANVQDANIELHEALQKDSDGFFVGIATINPTYPAWRRDMETCVKQFGFRGVRMIPEYHNYLLTSRAAWELALAAGDLGIPVLFPRELVNYRQRHWMEPEMPLRVPDMLGFVSRFPDTRFLVMETDLPIAASYPANLYVEMSRTHCCQGRGLDRLITAIGAEHVLFGSGAPFREIEASLIKMHHARLSDEERALVEHDNAVKLFQMN